MGKKYLDFEKSLEQIEKEIDKLKSKKKNHFIDTHPEIIQLRQELESKTKEIFSNLTPWQKVKIARHFDRPHTLDYIEKIFEEFVELHGDRIYGDDPSIIAGIGKFEGISVVIIGHQKGKDTKENLHRKFGMAHPEGYRKAMRMMKLAEKFNFPVITFIDTPGAHPDVEAEERGQALAIAQNLYEMSFLKTPILCIIIGEGGSGGALGIGVGDRLLMEEYSIYSVISPEGCASILWKNQRAVQEAAKSLKLTADELLKLGIIDEIISEPIGGAHRNRDEMINTVSLHINKHIKELKTIKIDELVKLRYQKYRKIGAFFEKEENE